MTFSTYQVERALDRLRRWTSWLGWPSPSRRPSPDPVTLSQRAEGEPTAEEHWAEDAASFVPESRPGPPVEAVTEPARFAPVVEEELERRAGSFMRPPYPEQPPSSRIPRVPNARRPRRPPKPVGEGD